jgi:HYR domain/Domain of unknown function DUF11
MRTRKTTPGTFPSYRPFALAAFFTILAVALVGPVFSGHAISVQGKKNSAELPQTSLSRVPRDLKSSSAFIRSSSILDPVSETIETFASDCSTPQSSFSLGDTVCVKVTNAPVGGTLVLRRFSWAVRSLATVRAVDITSSTQTDSFTLPSTALSAVNGETIDNRGVWRIATIDSESSVQTATTFTVHDPATPSVDLEVGQGSPETAAGVAADSDVDFIATLTNNGPDTADGVTLVNSTPNDSVFVSVTQASGPSFDCSTSGGTTTCTAAQGFPQDASATFILKYHVNPGTPVDTNISNEVTVTSTTTELETNNNDSILDVAVTAQGTATSCILVCPDDITTNANTTVNGQRGRFVTYAPPASTGDCGTITSSPASGSFFPVGSTTVTATSETNNGGCSFTVTVVDNGGPEITCPADKQADADSNCQATVNVGTATATGDNVTIFATRSDGKPMYTCDANGTNCVRRSSDDPFSAGITYITWTAYSHDVPGPYASADDEEMHRTGSSSCTQTVTVTDVTPPTITATNQTVSADANCQAAIPDYSNSATDNCACASSDTSDVCQNRDRIVVTQDVAAGTLVSLGSYTIHLTATDEANNTSTKDVVFTVVDTTAPTFTFVPPAVVAYTGAGATTCDTVISNATLGAATASDNCGPVTITRSPSGNTFAVGTTTITWTATDGATNSSTATQNVTVIDNTPPVISCPANITLEPTCPSGAIATFANATASDNCGVQSVLRTAGPASGSVFPIGTTTVTFTATDIHGNQASCSFTVRVKTAAQTVQDMIAAVSALQPPLTGTQVQGLNAKLQAALDAINQGKTSVACNKLSDFISQVTAFINNGTLTSAQGTPLITSANHVRNTIGCTNNPCT